ncbi:MAG: FAD-dependent monooxygenase [Thiobacillaceae bacterium]
MINIAPNEHSVVSGSTPIIVGAGPVGAICALAMQHHGVTPRVLEARAGASGGGSDARRAPIGAPDARTLALSHGSRLILERLGVWARLGNVTPITRIHISQRGGFGTTRLSAADEHLPALGYVLSYGTLTTALDAELIAAGIKVEYASDVQRVEPGAVHTATGARMNSPLIVVADGGRSEHAPAPKLARDYEQMAVVCEVQTELPHANLAYERFTPDGPAALLPKGDAYALVWTARTAEAERIAALPDAAFLAALYQHFGGRQGRFLSATPRNRFPLKLSLTGTRAEAGIVRIGNAAQTLHPVSGQGFNLGLRDAWELAALSEDTPPELLGSAAMLSTYARSRRVDVLGGLGFTDFLVRAFSNDIAPIRHARGLGLLALEMCPPLKHFVARRMIFGARG